MSDSEKTIYDVIRDSLDRYPDGSDEAVAVDVLNTIGVSFEPARLLVGLVADVVEGVRRGETRRREHAVFGGSKRATLGVEAFDMVAARERLVESTFVLPDGRRVGWLDATVEEHEARVGVLAKHVAGVERTIGAHLSAVAAIRSAGVRCLGEIEGAA